MGSKCRVKISVLCDRYIHELFYNLCDFILIYYSKIWNAESGDEVLSLPHKHIVKSVDFSSDSVKLLTGSNEKLLRIFDLNQPESGTKQKILFRFHSFITVN